MAVTADQQTACTDVKCAIHGELKTRGAIREGVVRSARARATVVVEVPYTHAVPKYERVEKRRSKVHAHAPACLDVREGDRVQIAECRKLSKTKAHVVTKVLARANESTTMK